MDTETQSSRYHLLFSLETFVEQGTEFIDSLVPELKQIESSVVNLNNVKQFDELLTHLEASIESNNVELMSKSDGSRYLRIPSENVIRILLTLASRCSASNWTNATTAMDGLVTTNEQVKAWNEDYYSKLYKTPLRDRSIIILINYLNIIIEESRREYDLTFNEGPIANMLYKRLMTVMGDFISRSTTLHKSYNGSEYATKKPRINQPISPTKKNDIAAYFKVSPKQESRAAPAGSFSSQSTVEDQVGEVVSDSEEDEDLKIRFQGPPSSADMEAEINKFQRYNMSPIRTMARSIMTSKDEIAGINNASALFQNQKPATEKKGKASRERSSSPAALASHENKTNATSFSKGLSNVKESWQNLRVYDEDILSTKLNPKLNSNFNVWKLINWTFFCADRSSKYQNSLQNSSYSSYHSIYSTHSDTISVLFDLLTINFVRELKSDHVRSLLKLNIFYEITYEDHEEDIVHGDPVLEFFFCMKQSLVSKLIEGSKDILVSSLMTQIGPSQRDWYDRVIEYTFNGLGVKSYQAPSSCYEREKNLIRHDHTFNENFTTNFESGDVIHDDNLDSMKLRFKIVSLIHYWSLFFSNGSTFDIPLFKEDPHLNTQLLVGELSRKFLSIDYKYLEEFYAASTSEASLVPEAYKESLLFELNQVLLVQITKITEPNTFSITPKHEEEFSISRGRNRVLKLDGVPIHLRTVHGRSRDKIYDLQIQFLNCILSCINNKEVYLSILEDVTYKSFEEFYQLWMKTNFLLEWLVNLSFQHYDVLFEEQNGELTEINEHYEEVIKADKMRDELFEQFLKSDITKKDYNFTLTKEEREEIKSNKEKYTPYKDIVDHWISEEMLHSNGSDDSYYERRYASIDYNELI